MKTPIKTTGSGPMDMNTSLLADLGGIEFPVFREITPEQLLDYYTKGWVVFKLGDNFDIYVAMEAANSKVIWVASAIGEA